MFDAEFLHFDAIWLMGVWDRSPKSKEIASLHPGLQQEYRDALVDFTREDVIGSPYSVFNYHVDSRLGGSDGLTTFRMQLMDRDKFLILDYVPNHMSVDHFWTMDKSDIFIKGTIEDLNQNPNEYFSNYDTVYAHGRDPYFPPWTDTVQINAFSSEARLQAISTLHDIAEQCDCVRCDMAMLMTNEVFSRTWGTRAGPIPDTEFWEEIIPAIRKEYPNFLFIAEVYWEMEWNLQQQGFNYCYDKRLYERMAHENAQSINEHIRADLEFQNKLLRFIENHDEQRAVTVFGEERSRAAAIITLTLPGARLIHENQMLGHKIKIPVQLKRRPEEIDNEELNEFYQRLLKAAPERLLSEGNWAFCRADPLSEYDHTNINLITYQWWTNERRQLTIVNFSPSFSRAHVKIDGINYGSDEWTFTDILNHKVYSYKGEDLDHNGLYVDLGSWRGHIFEIQKKSEKDVNPYSQ